MPARPEDPIHPQSRLDPTADADAKLRQAAARTLRRNGRGSGLTTDDLAHEAWLRLQRSRPARHAPIANLSPGVARAMRCILIDEARAAVKARRSAAPETALDDKADSSIRRLDFAIVRDALLEVGRRDPVAARAFVLRVLAERTIAQAARALGVSASTIERAQRRAKALLRAYFAP